MRFLFNYHDWLVVGVLLPVVAVLKAMLPLPLLPLVPGVADKLQRQPLDFTLGRWKLEGVTGTAAIAIIVSNDDGWVEVRQLHARARQLFCGTIIFNCCCCTICCCAACSGVSGSCCCCCCSMWAWWGWWCITWAFFLWSLYCIKFNMLLLLLGLGVVSLEVLVLDWVSFRFDNLGC